MVDTLSQKDRTQSVGTRRKPHAGRVRHVPAAYWGQRLYAGVSSVGWTEPVSSIMQHPGELHRSHLQARSNTSPTVPLISRKVCCARLQGS
jgi:hypothetical protein